MRAQAPLPHDAQGRRAAAHHCSVTLGRQCRWQRRRGRRLRVSLPESIQWPPCLEQGGGGARIAVVVPFRQQLPLQDRQAQLQRFVLHMEAFLSSIPNCQAAIVVVEQSQDGRKFNRGQLLNVGFHLAREILPRLTSFITHDVDLLPSSDMRPVYANPPPEGSAVHLAAVWSKYSDLGSPFIGGVLAFGPADFERINGFPNDYWGWGLEDDQLGLRMARNHVRPLRVRVGSFEDLDPINMKGVLERGRREEVQQHLPWYNSEMFRQGGLSLDKDWSSNGLSNLSFETLESRNISLVHHFVVQLGTAEA
ncbi:unnamed protein product [Polarella glacialis]|uniref:Uncharacterized protein n=1 Tax=Polarella glacialis TaxID=89957 RepID=A0A813IIQ3_POLGL|nr:unnamed protein product [Polarella glacialis]CAE8653802.1 unnamed protein product [Polarella glacialis]